MGLRMFAAVAASSLLSFPAAHAMISDTDSIGVSVVNPMTITDDVGHTGDPRSEASEALSGSSTLIKVGDDFAIGAEANDAPQYPVSNYWQVNDLVLAPHIAPPSVAIVTADASGSDSRKTFLVSLFDSLDMPAPLTWSMITLGLAATGFALRRTRTEVVFIG